jgi:hypothetical protein
MAMIIAATTKNITPPLITSLQTYYVPDLKLQPIRRIREEAKMEAMFVNCSRFKIKWQ